MYRPSSADVLSHCLFWKREKQLTFFQDVSDRTEREPVSSSIVQALERNSLSVVKGDWRNHISDELREGKRAIGLHIQGRVLVVRSDVATEM